ncbi:MAG: 9-O-acetylesterase [Prevotella sp.]|jgi:sialate O-acetylesterase|nr:9-O-acetylesterase [Prevotella sp.]
MKKFFLLFCATLFAAFSLRAEIKLSQIFSDNMVLQQQSNAPVWGTAAPNKTVNLVTSWDNKTYSVKAAADGKWKIEVQTPQATNTPYSITISDGKKLVLNNVLIGEVWVCSGQSNMEMPLSGWGKVINYEQEIASANYPAIRLLHVKRTASVEPLSELVTAENGWQVCSPAAISEFSSVAYFFGRHLNRSLNIPVGLINTSWGGTIAEAWTSGESLKNMPAFRDEVSEMANFNNLEAVKQYKAQLQAWQDAIAVSNKTMKKDVAAWSAPAFDDSSWKTIQVSQGWEKSELGDYDGVVWHRKTIDIPASWAGQDLHLSLGWIDDEDITYFNGQQIGETHTYAIERHYTVPARMVKPGKAVILIRVYDSGGGGGMVGSAEELYIQPTGSSEQLSLASAWKYYPATPMSIPKSLDTPNRPAVLYNAMIHPLLPYAIQGAIWYQGESNAERAEQYKELMPLLIRDWRKAWNRDIPFYLVQLANYKERKTEPQDTDWARLREAQLQTLRLEKTGMAVAIDIGDDKDIHPKNKQEVGRRLALIAEKNIYKKDVVFSGPIYRNYRLNGDKIHIRFAHADGLKTADGNAPTGFAIAGSDHLFHWAEATIKGNEVVVYSPEVAFPVAVRYAWADNPACNLVNGADLPASPFRTDCW